MSDWNCSRIFSYGSDSKLGFGRTLDLSKSSHWIISMLRGFSNINLEFCKIAMVLGHDDASFRVLFLFDTFPFLLFQVKFLFILFWQSVNGTLVRALTTDVITIHICWIGRNIWIWNINENTLNLSQYGFFMYKIDDWIIGWPVS